VHLLLDPSKLISDWGPWGLFAIIFAETGLLIGFFLPGDSLLVTAGVLASPGKHDVPVHLDLGLVLVGVFVAAAAGAELGYVLGRQAGPALFNRPRSRLFKPENVERAHGYFDRFGNVTVILARFIPVVRTFANPVAGAGRMEPRTFTLYNIAGAALWAMGVTMLGYVIGNSVKDTILIPAVIVASFVPIGIEVLRHRRAAAAGRP
jgi:membrane-associated protein